MSFLSQLTFTQFVQLLNVQYNAIATLPAGTDEGEPLGAIFNADSLLATEVQTQIAYAAMIERLSTIPDPVGGGPNPDVDSFCSPFGVTRLPASSSSGQVTFSTGSAITTTSYLAVGTIVQTSGGVQFIVIADTTNPAYNATLNAYAVAPVSGAASSITVAVVALTAGIVGNVAAGTITQIYSGPNGASTAPFSTVTNAAAFTNGTDLESNSAMKTRFTLVVSGQRSGVFNAVAGAILGVQNNLTYSIGDELNPDGSSNPGFFTVVVNVIGQSSGPGAQLIDDVLAAVLTVKPLGISCTVVAPTLLDVNVAGTLTIASGYTASTVVAAANAAVAAYIDSIGLSPTGTSTTLSYGRVFAILFGVAGVANVDGLTLNGTSGTDIVAPFGTQIVAGTCSLAA